MKYTLSLLLICLAVFSVSCKKEIELIPVTGVTLPQNNITMIEGEIRKLSAVVEPSGASDKSVKWYSSNSYIASVVDGVVTAANPGKAIISVKTIDGNYTATCEVLVNAKSYPAESVSLDRSSVELTEGDETVLTATVLPENASDKSVEWSSDDESVAIVSDGRVTAVSPGTATITVTTVIGGYTAKCQVTVNKRNHVVESVSLDRSSVELTEGDETVLTATVLPENATDKSVEWSSDDESVATVSDGRVTAVSPGTATVTVTTVDGGFTASCEVTVNARVYAVECVTLDRSSVELTEGDETVLTATVLPENATDKSVEWSSDDESVATVSDGRVTAVSPGTATVTVTTVDGGFTASCEVTVNARIYAVECVILDRSSVELTEGDETVLTATVLPENATDKSVEWSSDDESVATVSDGRVTAVSPGTATVTVTTVDGGFTASCEVTVNARVYAVECVTLDRSSVELTEGDETVLTATVLPENATDKSVEWSSDDESVATVSGGRVTAVSPGTATVTVTTVDGGFSATCEVTVNARVYAVECVTLDRSSVELTEGDETVLTATVLPENATDKSVEWSSDDESVAIVSGGRVAAVSPGTATVTVTTVDGGFSATCVVTVKKKPGNLEDLEQNEGIW